MFTVRNYTELATCLGSISLSVLDRRWKAVWKQREANGSLVELEEEVNEMNTGNLWRMLLVVVCVSAWVGVAKHPTARNLRAAVADTLPLL